MNISHKPETEKEKQEILGELQILKDNTEKNTHYHRAWKIITTRITKNLDLH